MAMSNLAPSAFIRRLNQVSAGVQPRIGFRAGEAEAVPALLVVVTVPGIEPDLAEAAVGGGANALQVRMNLQENESKDLPALQSLIRAAGACPCGVVLAGTSGASLKRIESWRAAGVDFVVLGTDSEPATLGVSGIGKVIFVDHTTSSDLVRSTNELPFDGVEVSLAKPDEIGKPLAIGDIMRYRSLSTSVRKPIIVRADRRIKPGDVAALREARVEALSIDAAHVGTDRESIRAATAEFTAAVKALGVARGRGAGQLHPMVPRLGSSKVTSSEPEEEPEEE